MGCREIQGLLTAVAAPGGPWGTAKPRRTLIQAKGLAYERKLAAGVPGATRGQWWRFVDANGPGWCQTDVVLEGTSRVLVLESKLTWVIDGHVQLERLYRPVVELATGKPVVGMVVCRNLCRGMPQGLTIVGTLAEGMAAAAAGKNVVLHWLGNGPLMPKVAKGEQRRVA